ncbi:asparagine synthase (glutamine-hydrolyzing) [Echinicola sediminis]
MNLILNFPNGGARAIEKLMQGTQHRGPDHSAWLELSTGIFLAGNRLKTSDLGDWPNLPVVIEEDCFLAWNGALYNADELRNQLLSEGLRFESRSDTEVLGKWLKARGRDGIQGIQGMYALLFVNGAKEEILVARDPYGKKPLYFFNHNESWIFSSEASAMVNSGLVENKIDSHQFLPYYFSRHSFPEHSFFKGIKQLLPGQILELDWNGKLLNETKASHETVASKACSKARFNSLLTDAVLRHFHADVPVGVLLSGGADSSLLLHTWVKETGVPLHTFTVTYEGKGLGEFQDSQYARALASQYNCAHHEIQLSPGLVLENWAEYIRTLDQPVGDSAGFISWMIAKEAKKHVKILISGAGADELFGGYNRHEAFRFYLKHKAGLTKWGVLVSKMPTMGRGINKFLEAIENSEEATFLNFSSLQAVPSAVQGKFLAYYPKEKGAFKSALAWDRDYYLINDILKIHDNALMVHGVEGRAPYLDKALVELSNSMSEEQHLALSSKQWIRELLNEAGLSKYAKRKKLGFGLPLKSWLTHEENFRNVICEVIRDFEKEWTDQLPQEMRDLAIAPEANLKKSFLQVWNLFVLASWCKKNRR